MKLKDHMMKGFCKFIPWVVLVCIIFVSCRDKNTIREGMSYLLFYNKLESV